VSAATYTAPLAHVIMCAMTDRDRYRTALLDWLGCACAGLLEPAARAARAAGDGLLERVAALGTAGHVLDYDDTYAPGVIHVSAPVAPAALVLGAELGAGIAAALDAYAAGFEAAAALAKASHPALYDGGWHPTAVCGSAGAAVAAAHLFELDPEAADTALALALLRAGGLRAAFGSDGKALQVGMAAATGIQAAQLAKSGVRVPLEGVAEGPTGFADVFGGRFARADPGAPAIRENWVKAYPCCLGAHSTIEAIAELSPEPGPLAVIVHPLERQAAWRDEVDDGLEAKFSLPYLAAYTVLHGLPTVASFGGTDEAARDLARMSVAVRTDASLGEWEARIECAGREAGRIEAALGSPERPLDATRLRAKLAELAGDRLDGALDDETAPAAGLLRRIGFG
jgi:2-methylcitrate dehydratase PrpD